MKDRLISKKDILLLTALVTVALLVFIAAGKFKSGGDILVITTDGREILRERLSEEKDIRIEDGNGGYNVISIVRDGDGAFLVMCTESNCPEKVCIEKGPVTLTDDPIVCLPHRMTAKLIRKSSGK